MPVMKCEMNGMPGFKYGESGKCYTYPAGDNRAAMRAREKAEMQGRAQKAQDEGMKRRGHETTQ